MLLQGFVFAFALTRRTTRPGIDIPPRLLLKIFWPPVRSVAGGYAGRPFSSRVTPGFSVQKASRPAMRSTLANGSG